ncbi:Stealth CR1 domain-containing protein [Leuconostoc gasicomitatum]|uniref:Stealth CR1 domain-containing protein n=1 Tax=Leuconostoc gasicomitatum TaxID=115778 RepID=A0A9Q3XU00_9LACO|nr:Stealth CR1 domain-containing protein [Leuconostoc gasicomitatum]MBZ5963225.1 Stealth CR1 domain-containing protein [Leuconostoc gasicomitatum]
MLNKEPEFPIDFVVTWVNDADKEWQAEKNIYENEEDDDKSTSRFRDTGLFKYWFRSVELYTPWVNHIYLVTNGQVPEFLDLNNKKITVVNHREIMASDALPTFNSNAIEVNIDKILNLSENFVVFNDDMFINKPLYPSDFFNCAGLPKDTAGLNQIMPHENFDHIIANNISLINNEFNKKEVLRKHWQLFFNFKNGPVNIYTSLLYFFPRFSRLYDLHVAYSFKKSLFSDFMKKNNKQFLETTYNKFRSTNDISIWGVRYYQIVTGNISPRRYNFGKFYTFENSQQIIQDILKQKHHIIDINDTEISNYSEILNEITKVFDKKLSKKSLFEK